VPAIGDGMQLTRLQYNALKFAQRRKTEGMSLRPYLKDWSRKAIYFSVGVALAFFEDIAPFGYFPIGMAIGGGIESAVDVWGISRVHPAFDEFIDWKRVEAAFREYENDHRMQNPGA
jgi:hypothetical protein